MKKVILCKGIPASGKSTWSIKFVSENPDFIRVSRDDFRTMLNNYNYNLETEKLVNVLRNNSIIDSLNFGYNVVIDETSCKSGSFKNLISLLKKHKIKCEVIEKYFYIPLDEALLRNSKRDRKVPEDVIKSMYVFCNNKNYVEKHKVLDDSQIINYDFSKLKDESLPKCILIDLDGTVSLFNCYEKDFVIPNTHYRNAYNAELCYNDSPNTPVFEAINMFNKNGYKIIFASGREEKFRQPTMQFLNKYLDSTIEFDLFMRKDNDVRSDVLVKEEILVNNLLNKYHVYISFDDRDSIVKFYRDIGLNVWQVNYGNF